MREFSFLKAPGVLWSAVTIPVVGGIVFGLNLRNKKIIGNSLVRFHV